MWPTQIFCQLTMSVKMYMEAKNMILTANQKAKQINDQTRRIKYLTHVKRIVFEKVQQKHLC